MFVRGGKKRVGKYILGCKNYKDPNVDNNVILLKQTNSYFSISQKIVRGRRKGWIILIDFFVTTNKDLHGFLIFKICKKG